MTNTRQSSAACPHCQHPLEKRPSRKKKCPHCGQYIYVRTRPSDRTKVLVTEKQAEEIEHQWDALHRAQAEARLLETPGYGPAKKHLKRSLGRDPTAHEVTQELARREMAQHRADKNWGLYRNSILDIAQSLQTQGDEKTALTAYMEVSYLDLNGPRNCCGVDDPVLLAEYPPFEPSDAILSPGIVWEVAEGRRVLGLTEAQLRETFIAAARTLHAELKLPVSPENAWTLLKRALSERAGWADPNVDS